MIWINMSLLKLIHWPEYIKNKLRTFRNHIPKNLCRVNMKWNLLVFIKNKAFMYLFKTKKMCNVIYSQSFLKNFENGNNTQHGKLLRFLRSSHLRSSIKKVFLKISQNSLENNCVGVSVLKNLHASGLQLYQKGDSDTGVFL